MVKPVKRLKNFVMFSDGRTISPELNEALEVSRCSACREFYWIEDAPVVGGEVAADLPLVRALSIAEYEELISEGIATMTTDEEEIIRTELLWAFNDRTRQGKPLFESDEEKAVWQDNIDALYKMLDTSDVYSRLLKAEIAREMGLFEEAETLLSSIKEAQLAPVKRMMLNAVKHGETEVFKIENSEE